MADDKDRKRLEKIEGGYDSRFNQQKPPSRDNGRGGKISAFDKPIPPQKPKKG